MATAPAPTPTKVYHHVFRRLGAEQRRAIIEHNLGQFPVVDVYELLGIPTGDAGPQQQQVQFFMYYGHDELDSLLRTIGVRVPREVFGTLIEQLLSEYGVQYNDDDSLGDVVNDFLDAFFAEPGADEMDHRTSPWIEAHRDQTVGQTKERGEWDDIRWAARPVKMLAGEPLNVTSGGATATITPLVSVEQLSYNALAVTAAADLGTVIGPNNQPVARDFIDVMLVMSV
ncbi:MAG: hypothetical protein U0822_24080 [Anaerolineae bacterium]